MTEWFFYGLIYSLILALLLASLLLVKRLFSKQLSPRGQYRLWLVLPAVCTAPFLPFSAGDLLPQRTGLASAAGSISIDPSVAPSSGMETVRDLAVDIHQGVPQMLILLLLLVWAAGALFMFSKIVYQLWLSRRLLHSAAAVQDASQLALFYECKKQAGIRRTVTLSSSPLCRTPSALGILRPHVMLPNDYGCRELKYVLLHELAHHRYRDPLTNLLVTCFKAVFWFNPMVHLSFQRIALDREMACDDLVLELLEQHEAVLYGRAILNCAHKSHPAALALADSGSIRRRILQIADHSQESAAGKRISRILLGLFLCLTVFCVPSVWALADSTYHPDQKLPISHEDLSPYFQNMEGSFVLFDQSDNRYTIYNEKAARTRVSPDSTYKIYSGLLALESGAITRDRSELKWDGTDYPFEEWNRDQTLDSAMKSSVNWYFQRLDRMAGKENLQKFISSISYGNEDLSSGIEDSWLEASLAVSPLEQVQLLQALYENKWNFDPQNISAVKNALHISDNVFGKTGTGSVNGRLVNGWFVGWLDSGQTAYFFAANVQAKDGASGSHAMEITRQILQDKGLLGK